MAPNKSSWYANKSNNASGIDFNYMEDSTLNADLKGTWNVAFQASGSNFTFTPYYSISYYYEYGD